MKHQNGIPDMSDHPFTVDTQPKLTVGKTFILRPRCHINVLFRLNYLLSQKNRVCVRYE